MSLPPIFPVLAHHYSSRLVQHACIYEHLPPSTHPSALWPSSSSSSSSPPSKNALVFIGGLGDGPHTVPAVRAVAARVAPLGWGVFEVRLNSSFGQWGCSSLRQDVREIGEVVRYLRRRMGDQGGRVVLMGHSTGCQDCMEYVTKGSREEALPPVDGIILQGPVSDREGLVPLLERDGRSYYAESLEHARRLVEAGRGDDEYMPRSLLPAGWDNPITAYRWHSLVAVGGDDDYFSSDLSDDKVAEIWGGIQAKVLIVPSEKDEHVPGHINVPGLVGKWTAACRPGVASDLSGLIPGANHRVDYPEGQEWLADRVARFLERVGEQGV